MEVQVPEDFGPAVLLVAPVTDALKKVSPDGLVEGSVDRGSILQVEGIALDAATIAGLDEDELQMAPLICAVIENGVELDARPAASLLRSQLGPP